MNLIGSYGVISYRGDMGIATEYRAPNEKDDSPPLLGPQTTDSLPVLNTMSRHQ